MGLYSDSAYPVREDVTSNHAQQFEKLGSPGTWGTSAQRLAIVNEARPHVSQWWHSLGHRSSILNLDEYEGHTADINSDHAKAGLRLVDEARDRLQKFKSERA
jgi:hypothetical protein